MGTAAIANGGAGVAADAKALLELGAKATCAVPLNAFGTWADGQTIVLPGIGSHTIRMTATGDIDLRTLSEADAKVAICAYLNAHAGATCSVAIVGSTLTVTALAYGPDLNGQAVTGTLLTASGTMAGGANSLAGKADLVGGTVPVSQLPAATPSTPGMLSAADQTKLDSLLSGGWIEEMAALALTYAPTLDNPTSAYPPASATLTDAGMTGNYRSFTDASPLALTATVVSNPSVVSWMVAMRGVMPIPSGDFSTAEFGLFKSDFSAGFSIASEYATDATHLVVKVGTTTPVVTSHAIDGLPHDYVILFDGTDVKVLVDGVLVGTVSPPFTAAPTTASCVGLVAADSDGPVVIQQYGYAWDPAFSPAWISGCVLWIRASVGVTKTGNTLVGIADQSGELHHVQAVGTPQYVASAINGLPGLSFPTAGDYLQSVARLFAQNAERHIFAVVRPTAGGAFDWGGSILCAPSAVTSPVAAFMAILTGGTQYFYSDGASGGKVMTGAWLNEDSLYEVKRASGATGAIDCLQNGIARSTGLTAWTESDVEGFVIGNRMDAEARFSGYICEVLAFDHILTAPEATQVRNYFGALYEIPMPA